ncbi:chemotaxis protein CheW [Peptostreptococcaceae bacterium AGR-M142]
MAEEKYVIFRLDEEEYGVNIMKVREVSEVKKRVNVPNTPDFIDGIINLRGEVTPIVSLKKRFNLTADKFDESARIIISNVEDKVIGFLVDEASQVISIDSEDIEETPEVIMGIDRQYIQGIGKTKDKMIIILDLDKVLTREEVEQIGELEEKNMERA